MTNLYGYPPRAAQRYYIRHNVLVYTSDILIGKVSKVLVLLEYGNLVLIPSSVQYIVHEIDQSQANCYGSTANQRPDYPKKDSHLRGLSQRHSCSSSEEIVSLIHDCISLDTFYSSV